MTIKRMLIALAASVGLAASMQAGAAATIAIINGNAAGVGFNDPTPAAPVGGNPGTTLGQQRINAFLYAASIWGANIDSAVVITVLATMEPLSCTATGAVLGSAGPVSVFRDFPGAVPGYWYHVSLTAKIFGSEPTPGSAHIRARFNSNLGNPGCLTGSPFYLGLDGNAGALIDLSVVLLHEFGHGLGFSTVTSGTSGNFLAGFPSIYDKFAFDNTAGKTWDVMTPAERQASAINPRGLVWNGANVTAAAPSVLVYGTPYLEIRNGDENNGFYQVGAASFGPQLSFPGLNKPIMPVVDQADGSGLACDPLSAHNAFSVKGKIAIIDRGVCGFTIKVKNAQDAGAKGVIIVDNVDGSPPAGLGGADPTITIPAVRVTKADGAKIRAAQINASGGQTGAKGILSVNPHQLSGADTLGRVMLFSPNPFQGGSSVSHWDTLAFKNLLMEPFINADLKNNSVKPPDDLTLPMFKDIGW